METPEQRTRTMRAVKSKDTAPEIAVRRIAHAMGFRFRLHGVDLPGTPDLVFPKRQTVIFVHGCFWHGHHCARGARVPARNREYWTTKIARNVTRDQKDQRALRKLGWKSLIIWECELKTPERLRKKLARYLA